MIRLEMKKIQYINREASKISALSCGKLINMSIWLTIYYIIACNQRHENQSLN